MAINDEMQLSRSMGTDIEGKENLSVPVSANKIAYQRPINV